MRGFVILCMVLFLAALAGPALAGDSAGSARHVGQQFMQSLENATQVLEVPVFYEISHAVAKTAAAVAVAPVKVAANLPALVRLKPARRAAAAIAHLKPARRAVQGVGLLLHPRRRC